MKDFGYLSSIKKKKKEEYTKWSLEFSLFNSECYVYFVTIETI